LENEVYKITAPEQIKEQRNSLVKFIIAGKKNASQIEEVQLQHFYNLLIIYIEYYCGNLDSNEALQKINAVITISETHNFPTLKYETEQLLNRLKLDLQESHEVLKHPDMESEEQTFISPPISSEPEPIPPPLPLGTPSSSTILPQEQNLFEGLQSLESVQQELRSTLEALSRIESDLNPRPISPTDKIHALNIDLDVVDKIPTFEDIQETFSDLESLDFPEIQFGAELDEPAEEPFEEKEMFSEGLLQKINPLDQYTSPIDDQPSHSPPPLLNPPPNTIIDSSEKYSKESEYKIPSIKELPQSPEEITEPVLPLNPPPFQSSLSSPVWRTVPSTVHLPPVVNSPPQMNPPPAVIPPPRLNLPPSPSIISNSEQNNEPREPNLPNQIYTQPSEQASKPKVFPRSSFFNSFNNGSSNSLQNEEVTKEKLSPPMAKSSELKTEKVKRDRRYIHRRIICSFCGITVSQEEKQCPNCGSTIKK